MNRFRNFNWPRILAEGVAIVVSILLAFGIQAWWDEKSQRVAEFEYLESLHGDFLEIQQQLADQIKYINDRFRSVDRVLEVIGERNGDVSDDDFSILLGQVYDTRTIALPAATYQDMVNSGNLRLIRDQSLRSNIVQLVALLRKIEDHSRLINQAYWDYHAPFVRLGAIESDFGWYRDDNTNSNTEVARMVGSYLDSPFGINVSTFKSREFWNLMFEWKVLYADQLNPTLRAHNYSEEIAEMIESLIDSSSN